MKAWLHAWHGTDYGAAFFVSSLGVLHPYGFLRIIGLGGGDLRLSVFYLLGGANVAEKGNILP